MQVSRLHLRNWRNFKRVDVPVGDRIIVVGPNASGKSNLLDALRFLRDVARHGGGVQKAVADRGGLAKIRSLAARRKSTVHVELEFKATESADQAWRYVLSLGREPRGYRRTLVSSEKVWRNGKLILDRPNDEDRADEERLTQSHLEQINSNQEFRPVAKFLEGVLYLHLVPQLVRSPEAFGSPFTTSSDPFGRNFLERIARTPSKTRHSRLRKIEHALRVAVPQFTELSDVTDEAGMPHLEARYEHWRPGAGKQREDQFSDGTIRLIGLLWALLETDPLLLLEEPELSLNAAIIRRLPSLMHRLARQSRKQVFLSSHSFDLLTDRGVGAEEVLVLSPTQESTEVTVASSISEVRDLLEGGSTLADALQPRMTPSNLSQLDLFE